MQAGAVVVAVKVRDLEREVRVRVRAIHNRDDAALAATSQISFAGKMWPVRLVMCMKWMHLGGRRDRAFEPLHEIGLRGGTGKGIFVSLIPSRATRCSHVCIIRP